ncbi:MAG: hypothetical protein QM636_22460 [Rhizobium sp.]
MALTSVLTVPAWLGVLDCWEHDCNAAAAEKSKAAIAAAREGRTGAGRYAQNMVFIKGLSDRGFNNQRPWQMDFLGDQRLMSRPGGQTAFPDGNRRDAGNGKTASTPTSSKPDQGGRTVAERCHESLPPTGNSVINSVTVRQP